MPLSGHKFNTDLLLTQDDRDWAAGKYPSVAHVLDFPELRQLFEQYDEPANRAKRQGRKAGIWAIFLGALALAGASAEHLLKPEGQDSSLPFADFLPCVQLPSVTASAVLAVCAGVAGVASVVIGGVGVLFAGKKREWLHNRLVTERTRQFHFQTLVFRLPEILASLSNQQAKDRYDAERKEWLAGFRGRIEGARTVEYTKLTERETEVTPWLQPGPADVPPDPALNPLFDAYLQLRIQHQLDYAIHNLRDDSRLFSSAPRRQAAVLSTIGLLAIVLICFMHLGILVGVFADYPFWRGFRSEPANVLIIWIAIAGLAARAIEQGLQCDREIERYRQYRFAVDAIRERFVAAASRAEKVAIMKEMEELSFIEMRDFLITNDQARFVL